MVIELEDTEPVVYRPYRLYQTEKTLVNDMIQEMMDGGIVRESSSPYARPIVLVQKKTGEKRLCVDYRALNRKTKKDHYPLPRLEDQLDLLAGNQLFTSLDPVIKQPSSHQTGNLSITACHSVLLMHPPSSKERLTKFFMTLRSNMQSSIWMIFLSLVRMFLRV